MKTFMNIAVLQGHTDDVTGCDISRDGILASTSSDSAVWLWDMNKQQCITVLVEHTSTNNKCQFIANGTLLASTCWDNTVRLWDMRIRHSIATLKDSNNATYQCSFSSDGTCIAAACGWDNVARVWDVRTLRCIATLNHTNAQACSFSSRGTIATGGDASDVQTCGVYLWH